MTGIDGLSGVSAKWDIGTPKPIRRTDGPALTFADRLQLSTAATSRPLPKTTPRRFADYVRQWLPAWASNALNRIRPTGNLDSVKQVGNGLHIVSALPRSARGDRGSDAEAQAAWSHMQAAASIAGVDLRVTSSYRSVARQRELFARSDGSGRWVARPGSSEHHTGLAFDVGTKGYAGGQNGNFAGSPAYRWLKENGYRFGFVQSMSWEPWQWRYDPQAVQKATQRR